jgi:hypothetical protein
MSKWRIGVTVALALMIPSSAAAAAQLALPAGSVPGLHSRRLGDRAARADLAAGLSGTLVQTVRRAALQTTGLVGRGVQLRSEAFEFSAAGTARRVLAAWTRRHRARRVRVGGGGAEFSRRRASGVTATVAWRDGARVGVLVLSTSRRSSGGAAFAREYAALADGWLRRRSPATSWGRVLEAIRPNATVPTLAALQAFELAYGPLPGVKPPPGRRTRIPSGTLAAQWVLAERRRLTAAQMKVVRRHLGIGRVARVATLGDPTFTPDAALQSIADHWVSVESGLLGHTLGITVIAGTSTDNTAAFADSLPFEANGEYGSGVPAVCRVRMLPPGQKSTPEFQRLVLAHEVFHCFQFDIRGVKAWWNPLPAWIGEGTADWVALTVDPVSWNVGGGNVQAYIGSPTKPIFARSYDAAGFWGHVQDEYGDLWKRLPGIIANGQNATSFSLANGDAPSFLNTWGSSFLRYPGGLGGPAWHMVSPLIPPELSQLATPADTIAGSGLASAPPGTAAVYIVNAAAGEPLLHVVMQGHGRLSPVNNYTDDDLHDGWFCTASGGCVCPSGTTGQVPEHHALGPHTALALGGDANDAAGSFADLTSYSLDTFCHKKPPQPSPNSGGTGVSNGDPYITTFDGGGYGFQTAGEFTLVKSTVDNLEIQSRQVPYPAKLFPEFAHSLAMNTAFAMRDGGTTVEVDKGSPLVLYINHRRRRVKARATIPLRGGGRVSYARARTTVIWRDGTRALFTSIGPEGVNIALTPSRARAGLLRGLLGADDGRLDDDFVGRTGRRYNADQIARVGLFVQTRAQLRTVLGGFGRSWRITQRQSLFVYPRGKSTRSYLVRGFPRLPVSLRSLPATRRRTAAAVCRRAGVTNATLLAGCEIDYGATGSRLLATSTATLQHAAGIKGSSTSTGSGVATSPVPWTQLSEQLNTSYGAPSVQVAGGQLVSAYHRASDQAIETAAFTVGVGGIGGTSRALPFTGWVSTLDPVLLPGPGGGLRAIVAGQHSTDGQDTLNGVQLASRKADGSFGTPSPLDPTLGYGATSAVLAADGSTPLWASGGPFGDQLLVFSGTTMHDLTADSPGFTRGPVIGRDSTGRVWLAWTVPIGSSSGQYMMPLDPQTGVPLGPAIHAPNSADAGPVSNPISMACGSACRLLYVQSGTSSGAEEILSWAPGENHATAVVSGLFAGRQHPIAVVAGAYTPSGRLWITWADDSSGIPYAELGGPTGSGGRLIQLPQPRKLAKHGFDQPAVTVARTVGDRLALVTLWNDGQESNSTSVWATVVNPK